MLGYERIKQIEAEFGSPFYIFDEDAFGKNYEDIVRAFSSRYEKFIPAYSYKTNYTPYLCKIIKARGGWAEVVSRLEYDLALKIGQDPTRIIFNGPVKHYEDIELALRNRSTVNLDSWSEIAHVLRYAGGSPAEQVKVGIRINIGLADESGSSHIQESLKVGRFGFDPDDRNIREVIGRLSGSGNIIINSLHGHTSTTDRGLWCYEKIAQTLCDTASRYLPESVDYINIGGGIFGYIPPQFRWTETPSFDQYAETVCGILKQSKWVQGARPYLVLEPGVAMAANTLSFFTKVVSVKNIRDKVFVTVDGSAFSTKPTLHKRNQPYKIIRAAPGKERTSFDVAGSTCMEKDYLLTEITDTRPQEGDYIKIDNVGAYTIVLSPPFINTAPPILVKDKNGYRQIRTRQRIEDMFANYSFE